MSQKLILMVGVPASGKSTKGRQVAEDNDFAYVSRDFVRNMTDLGFSKKEHKVVKKVFMALIEAALLRGDSVVADATHLNLGSRAPLVELGKQYGAEIIAVVMNTSYETCILRNSQRNELEKVPVENMRGMAKALSTPTKAEGFSSVYFYNEGEDEKWN
jgi:predicted kinase